jgi:hypothetical protein
VNPSVKLPRSTGISAACAAVTVPSIIAAVTTSPRIATLQSDPELAVIIAR